jgi:hypothetical protein
MKYTRKRRRARRRTKLRGGDPRYSWFPGPVSDLFSGIQHSLSRTNATLTGSYPGVNPNWRIQPALNIR